MSARVVRYLIVANAPHDPRHYAARNTGYSPIVWSTDPGEAIRFRTSGDANKYLQAVEHSGVGVTIESTVTR
jgi:hypothetical protein